MQKSNAWFFQFKFLSMLRSWEFLSVCFIQQKIHYLLHGMFHHLMVVFSSLGQLELSPTCLHLHSTEASILFALFVNVCRFSLLTECVLLNLNQYYLLVWGKKKSSSSFISSDYPRTLETASSSCALLGAGLHLIPTLEPEMGTISHRIPRGHDRGTRSHPRVSLFNIRVLYSEATERSEI